MKSVNDLSKRIDEIKAALEQRELAPAEIEQVDLQLDRLTKLIANEPARHRNLRELKGLGKELWRSIDVEEYLRKERGSWR